MLNSQINGEDRSVEQNKEIGDNKDCNLQDKWIKSW